MKILYLFPIFLNLFCYKIYEDFVATSNLKDFVYYYNQPRYNFLKNHFEVEQQVIDNYLDSNNNEYLIPNIIHHVWLGGELPEKYSSFIDSAKKVHPNWQINLWDDSKVDYILNEINDNKIIKEIYYKFENPGLRSDIIRLIILKQFGGIYLDIDFECLKPLDKYCKLFDSLFVSFPDKAMLANGFMGFSKKHIIIDSYIKNICFEYLDNYQYFSENNIVNYIQRFTGPFQLTETFFNFQKDIENKNFSPFVFPSKFFFSFPSDYKELFWNGEMSKSIINKIINPESIMVHYYANSWVKK